MSRPGKANARLGLHFYEYRLRTGVEDPDRHKLTWPTVNSRMRCSFITYGPRELCDTRQCGIVNRSVRIFDGRQRLFNDAVHRFDVAFHQLVSPVQHQTASQ